MVIVNNISVMKCQRWEGEKRTRTSCPAETWKAAGKEGITFQQHHAATNRNDKEQQPRVNAE